VQQLERLPLGHAERAPAPVMSRMAPILIGPLPPAPALLPPPLPALSDSAHPASSNAAAARAADAMRRADRGEVMCGLLRTGTTRLSSRPLLEYRTAWSDFERTVIPHCTRPQEGREWRRQARTRRRSTAACASCRPWPTPAGRCASRSSPTRLGVHRSIVYRILRTLEDHRLVSRSSDGLCELGVGLAVLSRAVRRDLQAAALPELTYLADELGMTAFLVVADAAEAVTLLTVEPRHSSAHVAYRPGVRHPVDRGAPGLALLSGAARRSGERAEVAEARTRGWARSSGEVIPGMSSVAAPWSSPGVASSRRWRSCTSTRARTRPPWAPASSRPLAPSPPSSPSSAAERRVRS
jgi:hypothetical protein